MSEKKSKKEPVKKDTILIVTSIGIIILVIALVFIIKNFGEKEEEVPLIMYNGFAFYQQADFWHFNWKDTKSEDVFKISLRFNPRDALDVPLEGRIIDGFNDVLKKTSTIYITFDPNATNFTYTALAAAELSISIARALDLTPIAACTINVTDTCKERPIVTCDDRDKAVVYLDADIDEAKIQLKDNCLVISGRGLEKLKAVDRVLYHWYDIY
jgi:hypothetical protein